MRGHYSPLTSLIGSWLGALAAALAFLGAFPVHAADDTANVLILNGADAYLPAYLLVDSAMRATLSEGPRRVVLYAETLDAQRFPMESLEAEYLALLAKKYSAMRIEVVVAFSRPALNFFMRHGQKLWPDARLVYQGFIGDQVGLKTLPKNATGVMAPQDVRGTVDLARRLQPAARRLVVITGSADLDKRYEQLARLALAPGTGSTVVDYLSGVPQAELLATVAALPVDSIVIFLTQFRDREGRAYTPRDLLREVSRTSSAPVYSISEATFGTGPAAGVVESLADRGRLVAEQVFAALQGGTPHPDRVLIQSPSRCVADARALRRWSIDESRLPDGCDVRFAERSFWREYLWVGIAGLLVIAAQAALIAALLVQSRRRRLAEAESRKRFSEMAHMNRRVALGEMSASIAHELNQPLGAILNNAGAAELFLKADPPGLREVSEILNDIKRDDQRASAILARIRSMLVKSDFEARPISLNDAIEESTRLLSEEAVMRGVTLDHELDPTLPEVSADPVEVKQVIVNLALNALEAMGQQQESEPRLLIRSRRVNGTEAEVSVSDSGPGIPAELLPRVFEAFVTSKATGMGLGLAISRTIIEAHGGKMRAQNGPEGGAVISFTLPLARAA